MDREILIVIDISCEGEVSEGGFGRQEGPKGKIGGGGDQGNFLGFFILIVQYFDRAPLIFLFGFGWALKDYFVGSSAVQFGEWIAESLLV